ncbi:MAG: ABC transporter substrate-binding protein [Phycisphaerae bacterium]|nr:helical backbone metal receptor [Tepidisphaeraceae bacterium]
MPPPARTRRRSSIAALAILCVVFLASCDKPPANPSHATTRAATRIASLVPAATDMLLSLGARDRLVAVSNYDTAPAVAGLPRVGDYQTTDWEALARLRPDVMIIQLAPDRLPPGLANRAAELGIALENVSIHRLDDVLRTLRRLGEVIGQPAHGQTAADGLQRDLDAVRASVATRPVVRVLISRDPDGRDIIGPNNFLDDLLQYAGAANAAAGMGKPYPSIDREAVAALAPDAVIVLLPDARPDIVDRANRFWAGLPQVPAVRDHRVFIITDPYAQVPGSHLARLAKQIAEKIHAPRN